MNAIKLKNGSTEAEPLVRIAMVSLSSLLESNPIAFFEAVMVARDQNQSVRQYWSSTKISSNTG